MNTIFIYKSTGIVSLKTATEDHYTFQDYTETEQCNGLYIIKCKQMSSSNSVTLTLPIHQTNFITIE